MATRYKIATQDRAETFTNKTLTSPAINTPTGLVKADVGLGNVDNTSDANKPVSTAQQTALDGKINHSLATTVNDFLVASGVGIFVKKTLAETKTVFGLLALAFKNTVATDDIDNNAVTNAKAAQMATKTYKGRTTAATGNAEDVPVATVKADLVLVKGDVGLGNVENTAHSTDSHTMTIDGRDVSVDGTKLDGIETAADVTDAVNIASSIVGVADKATPVDADSIGLIDSAAANVLKETTWANIKTTLKAYFDGIYAAVLGADDNYVTDAEKAALHAAATVADTDSLDLSLTGQQISGVVNQSWVMARSLFR